MSENANLLLNDLKARLVDKDIHGGKHVLSKLKILTLDYNSPPTTEQLRVATEALELGILLTVMDGDFDAFGRNIAQLKPYYNSATLSALSMGEPDSTSERKCHILGLNLMHLLVDNRLSEFHSELELLSEYESQSKYVSFPINLERQLMVGIYDEVLSASSNIPHESYGFFMDNLLQTVRDSIADCIEVSYKEIGLASAIRMMKFSSREELLDYMDECRDDWILDKEREILCFQPPPIGTKATDIPSMKLITQSLSYATEMERIV